MVKGGMSGRRKHAYYKYYEYIVKVERISIDKFGKSSEEIFKQTTPSIDMEKLVSLLNSTK